MCDRQLLNWTLLNPTQRANSVLNSNYITGTVCQLCGGSFKTPECSVPHPPILFGRWQVTVAHCG